MLSHFIVSCQDSATGTRASVGHPRSRDSELLELGVTLDEFFCAAAGEAHAQPAIVVVALDTDDRADSILGMANFLAEERIGVLAALERRGTERR